MCINFKGEARIAKRSFKVWKVVRTAFDGTFRSQYHPEARDLQRPFKTEGKFLTYVVGKATRSTSGPGVFAWSLRGEAQERATRSDNVVLECRVPKGAKVRRGTFGEVVVSTLTPIRSHA